MATCVTLCFFPWQKPLLYLKLLFLPFLLAASLISSMPSFCTSNFIAWVEVDISRAQGLKTDKFSEMCITNNHYKCSEGEEAFFMAYSFQSEHSYSSKNFSLIYSQHKIIQTFVQFLNLSVDSLHIRTGCRKKSVFFPGTLSFTSSVDVVFEVEKQDLQTHCRVRGICRHTTLMTILHHQLVHPDIIFSAFI